MQISQNETAVAACYMYIHTGYMVMLSFSCWMRLEGIYYAVLIPIGLVLICNTVVFGMVVHGLVCARRRMKAHQTSQSERKTALLHVKAGIAVFIVLGKIIKSFYVNGPVGNFPYLNTIRPQLSASLVNL